LAEKALDHGHYYTDPPIETIAASDNCVILNLIVGRHGFGEIQFERPVDLSGLASLDELLGKVVQFRRTICHVYPEGYQEPPVGEGLNVPAMVGMVRCWPPVKNDEESLEDYIKLLRMRPDTEFRSYDLKTGTWEFHVNHFSSYTDGRTDYYVSTSRPRNAASPFVSRRGESASLGEYSHVLRSESSYMNPVRYAPSEGNRRLVSLVNDAYNCWIDKKPIPAAILQKIEAIELTAAQFLAVFSNRDSPQARAIELIDGRLRFRKHDGGSHAGAIPEIFRQVTLQDPQEIFYTAANFGRVLSFSFTNNV
jgi:hypothetical protein